MIVEKKIGVVLVNYHTISQILCITRQYLSFDSIDMVVIVNNDTKNEELEKLESIESDRVKVFFEKDNLGYSKGNNIGIDYLNDQNFDYVIISNSDIEIEEKTIVRCVELLNVANNYGALSPRIINYDGTIAPYRSIPNIGFKCLIMNAFTFRYDYRHEKDLAVDSYGIVKQPIVSGSFSVCSMNALIKCNKFDSNIFLYREEEILAYRMHDVGYDLGIVSDITFKHNHPYAKESVRKIIYHYKLDQKSERYFFREYLKVGFLKMIVVKVLQSIVLLRKSFRQLIV